MRRSISALIACGLLLGFWVHCVQSAPDPAAAAKPTKQAIIGAWRLVSINYSGPNGAMADPVFGPNPQGIIIYDQSGWMSVQIVTANRPVLTRPARRTSGIVIAADAKLAAAAFASYYAYFGTWDYNADTSVITHHLNSSLLPYETGLEYRREVVFDGAQLKLVARSQESGEARQRTLVWARISDSGSITAAAAVPTAPARTAPTATSTDATNTAPVATPTAKVQAASPLAGSAPTLAPSEPPTPAAVPDSGPPTPAGGAAKKYGDIPADYNRTIRKYFQEHLKNPDSVQYQEITKPQQGYTTAISGTVLMREKRQFGWTVKATINAKNSHDRYVGFKSYTFLFRGEKIVDARLPLPSDEMIDSTP